MKTNIRLKFLIGITFLVFFLPFFDACTGGKFTEESVESAYEVVEEEIMDTIALKENVIKDTIKEEVIEEDTIIAPIEEDKSEENYFQRKESSVCNAYEMVYLFFGDSDILKLETLKDKTLYTFLIILLIIINSLIMLILAFKNRIKNLSKVGILSLILALIWFIYVLFLNPDLNQIKYGFYLYLINVILIILECKRLLKKE